MVILRRDTKQRKLVLEAVENRHDHPSAEQIFEDVHVKDSRISQGTVYRNLNLLSEEGEIYHVRVPGADRYDLRTDPHYHMICIKCKKVVDIPFKYKNELDEEIAKESNYYIKCHHLVFEGICKDCQKEEDMATSKKHLK